MNLTHLRYFAELAHTHHYTRAAQNLCITQPSLSHAIFKMEEELGVPLFEKNGKNPVFRRSTRKFPSFSSCHFFISFPASRFFLYLQQIFNALLGLFLLKKFF